MSPDDLFSTASSLAMVGWAILIVGPRRFAVLNFVPRLAIPFVLSALYGGLILAYFADSSGGYGSIAELRLLFSRDEVLLAGWVHYLAFDQMIGGYLASRMDKAGISRLVQAPILVSTFLFGPVGVVLALVTEAMSQFDVVSSLSWPSARPFSQQRAR